MVKGYDIDLKYLQVGALWITRQKCKFKLKIKRVRVFFFKKLILLLL